jgi:hypothetical protein
MYVSIKGKEGRRPEHNRSKIRYRPESILIKVEEGKERIEVYKKIMIAKEVLKESTGVRRTRNGSVLIGLKTNTNSMEIIRILRKITGL